MCHTTQANRFQFVSDLHETAAEAEATSARQ